MNGLDHRFTHHAPTPEQIGKLSNIRAAARQFGHLINEMVPESREKALAITKLEEAVMWANAGIVREEKEEK
ncbi:hypothetical protein [Paenibacillus xylanexedens]|uniref:Acb2/Tad1 domain-containing protein n=1 Tax=Paenibacillus xylanexedens TaxID=528191 RepID=UPI0011A64392|nr:hypothetical protein [Paenibacillus xylanexedens]